MIVYRGYTCIIADNDDENVKNDTEMQRSC
jgi:hypothetical protein